MPKPICKMFSQSFIDYMVLLDCQTLSLVRDPLSHEARRRVVGATQVAVGQFADPQGHVDANTELKIINRLTSTTAIYQNYHLITSVQLTACGSTRLRSGSGRRKYGASQMLVEFPETDIKDFTASQE